MGIAKLKAKQDSGQLGGGKSTVLKLKENESTIISILADPNKEIIDSFPHHKVHSSENSNTWPDKTLPCWEGFGLKCPMCQMEKVVKHKNFPQSQSRCVIQFINFDADSGSREKIPAVQRFVAWEGYFAPFLDTYETELSDFIDNVIEKKVSNEVVSIIKDIDMTGIEQYEKLAKIVGEEKADNLLNPLNGLTFKFKMSGKLPNATYTLSKMREKEISSILESKKDDIIILHNFWRKNSLSDIEEITGIDLSDFVDIAEFESYEKETDEAY